MAGDAHVGDQAEEITGTVEALCVLCTLMYKHQHSMFSV